MTSVDSGVETGNDSNDSSIVQHDNLAFRQISNVSTAVASTTSSSQKELHENEPGPGLPVGLHPVNENYISRSSRSRRHNLARHRSATQYTTHALRTNDVWIMCQDFLKERKLRLAATTNNSILMKRLLSSGVSPNHSDDQGRTPLHLASSRGYAEIVNLLLKHGANPNQQDCIGNTPLHLAAVTSKISVVTLLLQAGTDVSSLDQHGYNPLQLAQTKLTMLQNSNGEDMLRIKEEVHNVVSMLLAYLQKQKDTCEKVETLSTFCSRLSLSNTSDQVQDDIKDLLANLGALTITS